MNNNNLEVEIKFHVPDLAAFRERLLAAGAQAEKERLYERNIRFDNAWEGLRRKGQLLRLRQDDRARLTFKGMPPDDTDSEVKVREELEVEVSDFDTLAQLLEKVGFEPLQIYEKYRETFALENVEIVLDEMPFGNFVELEGPEEQIKPLAVRLALDWNRRILTNYLAIMGIVRNHFDLDFKDLTFENFADLDIDLEEVQLYKRN